MAFNEVDNAAQLCSRTSHALKAIVPGKPLVAFEVFQRSGAVAERIRLEREPDYQNTLLHFFSEFNVSNSLPTFSTSVAIWVFNRSGVPPTPNMLIALQRALTSGWAM